MQPYINITINVLLKNSNNNPSLRISYESAKNKNTIDIIDTKNNKNTSLQNCLKLFGFTKEEIFKLTLFKKYGATSTLYLLKSEKTTVDVQKQMQNHINKLVRNFSEPEIPYEKTEYTTKIINKNECIINNLKFLIELLKKYRKYLAVIYDFDIDVSYDDTYVMLTCSTDQSIADDKTIEVEINESTKSDADGYERFFNDVALTRLDSETDKEIKKPVFWRIFSDVDNKLIMNAVKNRTIDFYKAGNNTHVNTMYNVSLNTDTRRLQKEIRYNYLFVKEYADKKLSNNERTILDLEPDYQTTDIQNIDKKYYDIIECYKVDDPGVNLKHISKNDMLNIADTIINNIADMQ